MKNILLLLLILSPFFATSQKMKYNKDVYPFIKERKPEAFSKLIEYLNQDPKHSNATYWLAKYYDAFAMEYISSKYAKVAIQTYQSCLNNTSLSDFGVLNAPRYPDAKGVEAQELYISFKEFINSRIEELDYLIKTTNNLYSTKAVIASSIKELSEKLKIDLPKEIMNLTISDVQAIYSKKTFKGKTALNGSISIKGIDINSQKSITINGMIDSGSILEGYDITTEEYKDILFEGIIQDDRINEFSTSVKIGDQVWMAENLNVDKFLNGDPIPHAKTDEEWKKAGENKQPAWCYYDNDPANGEKYGKLYNWYAINDPRGLAPKGWRVPWVMDFDKLQIYLGGEKVAGKKMKSTDGWGDSEGKLGNGTNESGFSGVPCGYRYDNGGFYRFNIGGFNNNSPTESYKYQLAKWWTLSGVIKSDSQAATVWLLNQSDETWGTNNEWGDPKGNGNYVRCIRD